MANDEHREMLERNVDIWNRWRDAYPDIKPDLSEVVLIGKSLRNANLRNTDLSWANLVGTTLSGADLSDAKLFDANLGEGSLTGANLSRADCRRASFKGTSLGSANLSGADLSYADLSWANLIRANFSNADLTSTRLECAQLIQATIDNARINGCFVYGVSVWGLKGTPLIQSDLCITRQGEPRITVDDLEVAQFIYLLLENERIRNIINTITSRAVLILGRFTPPERKAVLVAIRDALRERGYVPILFDFTPSERRDLTETIQILANMAKFVVADLTDAKSIPQELSHIVPNLPSLPIQPIRLASQREFALFEHWRRFPWVLNEFPYEDQAHLINHLDERIIKPVETRLQGRSLEDELKAARLEIEDLRRQLGK